jgi:hypothetical protein
VIPTNDPWRTPDRAVKAAPAGGLRAGLPAYRPTVSARTTAETRFSALGGTPKPLRGATEPAEKPDRPS